jgi:hypothetical protein
MSTNREFDDVLRLTRKHIYNGEPYAPMVSSFVRMLEEYRGELCDELQLVLEGPEDQLRARLAEALLKLRERR